ncbi:hypothetical protein EGR_04022 [Echinococcus granulosus]|uniref:Uncharacterized protein n=1 Tax=Echinococcus granulosus TaxID=6210 RepID=W6V4Q5_ECHGR|nr:hypothetical protein EGR_04022 [Echinococcus granulosus]EUB61174.1 hypothetical protein EGR_04022 [Echinococcus granulosus]
MTAITYYWKISEAQMRETKSVLGNAIPSQPNTRTFKYWREGTKDFQATTRGHRTGTPDHFGSTFVLLKYRFPYTILADPVYQPCRIHSRRCKKRSFSAHKPDEMQTARQFEREQDDKDERAPNADSAEPSCTY